MKKMSKSARKFIRQEKSRIRKEVLIHSDQKEKIDNLYKRFLEKNHKNKNENKKEATK